jgi:sugar phosphate isomerase/epimerase
MKVTARSFRNAPDSVPYCRQLGTDAVIMECNHIPGWAERGYLEPGPISDTLEILDRGGLSCSVLVSQTVPVAGRTPQDNPDLDNVIKTLGAMGQAGVSTLLLFQLEEIPENADREALWPFFVDNHRPLIEAAAAADVNIAMHGYFPPMGLVDGNDFFARSFAEVPDIHNGICYDPGIMAICGDDPLAGLEAFKDRIHMVHIRDVNGDWQSIEDMRRDNFDLEVFPGTGIAKNDQVMRRLHEIGYQGAVQPEHLGRPSEAELLPAAFQYLRDQIASF